MKVMKKWFRTVSIVLLVGLPACSDSNDIDSAQAMVTPAVRFATVTATVVSSRPTNKPSPLPPATGTLSGEQAANIPVPTSTMRPTETSVPTPTLTPTPEPDWLNTVGRTGDNRIYLGDPVAPVTLIDYSDFM
jgi:hypothetical protein